MNNTHAQLFSVLNGNSKMNKDFHIAWSLLHHLPDLSDHTINWIAEQCDCSVTKLNRFIKNLGYEDYSEFRTYYDTTVRVTRKLLKNRYENVDEKKMSDALFSLSNESDLEAFLQTDTIEQIADAIVKAKKIIVVGSLEMQSYFITFQSDLYMMGKFLYIEENAQFHPYYEPEEGDLVIVCSMTGRIRTLASDILYGLCRHTNTLMIGQTQHTLTRYFLKIPAKNEYFDGYMLLNYYLDRIACSVYRRIGS